MTEAFMKTSMVVLDITTMRETFTATAFTRRLIIDTMMTTPTMAVITEIPQRHGM